MGYLKWEITKIRETDSYIKLTAFHAWDTTGEPLNFTAVSCTVNGNEPTYFSDDEHCENLIDPDTSKRFCCAFDTNCVLIFTVGVYQGLDRYSYTTSDNLSEWDPVSWKLYTSSDGQTWREVDDIADADITRSRTAETDPFLLNADWYMDEDGNLTNERFNPAPDVMSKPLPYQYWRIEPLGHNGYPYHELLPGIEHIHPTPVPERPPEDYICIFDMETKQTEFEGHGLAVLCPTVCEITEELNGGYQLVMEHPKDPDGKWEYIREWNIVKARGQLFVINKVKDNWQNNKGSITAWADHISYVLADDWIWPGTAVYSAEMTATDLLHSIMYSAGGDTDRSALTYYTFTAESDIELPGNFHDWDSLDSGATPYALLLGSDGFIAKFGGEMYRDNFYFSINQRMENSNDNAFDIRVGKNLCGISKTIDLTSICTNLRVYDQHGQYFGWYWTAGSLLRRAPRAIVRSQTISLPDENPDYYWDHFGRIAMSRWQQYCEPLISYDLTVKDLKKNPDFSMFLNVDSLKVGDKGKVWDVDLGGYTTLEITKTVTNAIKGEVTEVCFGTSRSFTRPYGYKPIVGELFVPVPVGGEIYLQDKEGYYIFDSEDYLIVEEVTVNNG